MCVGEYVMIVVIHAFADFIFGQLHYCRCISQ